MMMRTRIKMCGTTRIEDARAAVEGGVDALGFIFVDKSPRSISPSSASTIINTVPSFVSRVGVFVDADVEKIKSIVQQCGLTQLQLHGNETTEVCAHLKRWNMSLSLCKAFRVGAQSPAVDIGSYSPFVDSVLLDTYVKGVKGGTGSRFDWSLVESLAIDRPIILAGGLSPDNIREALSAVSPFAVDVNSGVEDRPGVKNHLRLSELVEKVAEVDYHRWHK